MMKLYHNQFLPFALASKRPGIKAVVRFSSPSGQVASDTVGKDLLATTMMETVVEEITLSDLDQAIDLMLRGKHKGRTIVNMTAWNG